MRSSHARDLFALVIAGAVAVALHLAMRRSGASDELGPESPSPELQQALMYETLGPGAPGSVDLATAPRDLDALAASADPTPWLIAAFQRCGSVSLAAFEGQWQPPADASEWSSPTMQNGRLQAGGVLRFEVCPVHVYSQSASELEALAVLHEDVHDPGDAWLTYVRLTRDERSLRVCLQPDRDRLGAETSCTVLTAR